MNNFDILELLILYYFKLFSHNYHIGKMDLWLFTSQTLRMLNNDTTNSNI